MRRLIVVVLLLSPLPLQADPWSISEMSPAFTKKFPKEVHTHSFWDNRFDYGYYFYQKAITPGDGERCGMSPTCAEFAYQALKKHGPFVGGWMGLARFMQDHGQHLEHYPLIRDNGRTRYHDPLTANDFWFTDES